MNTDENNQTEEVDSNTQNEEAELELEVEEERITISKSEWDKSQQTLGSLKREVKTLKKSNEPKESSQSEQLNDTQLNYLDVKGISEAEDLKIIETFVQKTGKNVREALKDDYVTAKLASNKTAREVQEAMPSGSKRGGNQSGDLSSAIAKYEATGQLPSDFKTRSDVINAFVSKGRANKPSWQ